MYTEPIKNLFYITDKIDNIPIILNDSDKIISNFEFALRIDPFLYIQLLNYSNLEGFGFYNKINRIEEIPLILDNNILKAIITSTPKINIDIEWEKTVIYYLMLYPAYLSIMDLLNDPNWLNEDELNILTLSAAGFALKKYFFKDEYYEIKNLSIKKKISINDTEAFYNKPKSNLITNVFFTNKKIPIIIPDIITDFPIDISIGKISFILELVDRFIKTNYYISIFDNKSISDFIYEKLSININIKDWFDILSNKMRLLFNYLLPENLIDKIFSFIKNNYDREYKRDESSKKISKSDGDIEVADLEEIKENI